MPTPWLGGSFVERIVGRESELGRISAFLDDDAPVPIAIWLEGVAGIGKTTLWHAGIEFGRERACRVFTCQPTAAEGTLSFAALGDLLSAALPEVLPDLPAPQQRAIEVALALDANEGPAVDVRVLGLALLSVLRLLASRCPVLIAVDDVQWLDRPSAAVLSFAVRRLTDERVKLLVSERTGAAATSLQLERDLSGRLLRIEVGPLSIGALHRMVVSRFGKPLSRPTLRRVCDASAGNPFYALEIAQLLLQGGVTLAATEPLPIPRTLEELVRSRLERLPETVQRLLEAAALLAEPTVAALTGVGSEPSRVGARLDRAAAAGVIEFDGERVRFTHPLLAASVVAGLGPRRRRQLHARLAQLAVSPEEQARHLALGCDGVDASVAESLEHAAQQARLRGAPAVAAELAELAAQRTPPAEPEARWRRLIEAGLQHATAGDLGRAKGLLEPLADEIPSGRLRGEVLLNLAGCYWDNVPESTDLAERALAEAGADGTLLARVHMLLSELNFSTTAPALRHGRAALEAAEGAGHKDLTTLALGRLVHLEVSVGEMTPGLFETARARAIAQSRSTPIVDFESPCVSLGLALLTLNRFEEARDLLVRARADSLEQGVPESAAAADSFLSDVECRLGDWSAAELYAAECTELYEQLELRNQGGATYGSAFVHAHLGNVDQARAAAEDGAATAAASGNDYWLLQSRRVLCFLELSLGHSTAAVEFLHPLVRHLTDAGWRWSDSWDALQITIEALVSAGELDEATVLFEELHTWGRTLDSAWKRAAIARCQGLLWSARGDQEAALASLTSALDEHERLHTPFERARCQLALGTLQRRSKQRRAARVSLEAALGSFEKLGALLWIDNARAELGRVGGRAPAGDVLTHTERQIAALIAEGMSNKATAAKLSVTVKTVEASLTRIYAKLGVQSRTELALLLAGQRPEHH